MFYAVAEADGKTVGFVKFSRRELPQYQLVPESQFSIDLLGGVHIEKIAVAQGYRGHGFGKALYRFVEERLQPARLYSFITISPCMNGASIRFHEALGFARTELDVPYEMPDGSWFLDRLYVLETGHPSMPAAQALFSGTEPG